MALEEVSFYNANGDEINISNIVNQMINYYEMKLEVGETRVTDFNEGSEIRNLLEAFAVGIYALLEEQNESTKIAFIQTSYGNWLDKIGELPFINLERITGEVSQGSVIFSIPEALTNDIVIPDGTLINSSDTGLDFETLGDATIFKGETSCVAVAQCTVPGGDGNVNSGSIDTIIDDGVDRDLLSVTNEDSFRLGADFEDDDSYRERLLLNVQSEGFGSVGYYVGLCEDVLGVHDVKLVDDATFTRKVLVNGDVKPTPDSVLLEVVAVLSALENLVIGHSFTVDRPVYTGVDLVVDLSVSEVVGDDDLLANLTAFFDGGDFDRMEYSGLCIDESLSRNRLVDCLLVFGDVVSVDSVLCDGSEVVELVPSVGGVLKLGSVVFNQTVVQ